ncbi:hypothetical protein [Micavibrio aeruginosavorus]|uniref:Uncharacterized protein n=1 Tax=Micavibrio aeruginosavorus EPB TaxID=349215 RepID=M4VXW3_9BACT|nr:hypothetical protein [Micavibrio aeruginosavorus]AGH98009.1 hypothetical protein A11S_1195 [Micavibrio aeruginosavorus EPB]
MPPDLPLSREILFLSLAILVSLIRYATYFHSIYKKETRPHVFSWLNWGIMVGIGAYAQFTLDGGASVWALVFVSVTCLLIAFLSLFVGEKNITRSDWLAFIGALAVIPVWMGTQNPFFAIIALMVIDILSYYPTIRKSWNDPWGEPPVSYFWAGLRYFFALLAVPEFTVHTVAYPFFLMAGDWGFALYVVWRRQIMKKAMRTSGEILQGT